MEILEILCWLLLCPLSLLTEVLLFSFFAALQERWYQDHLLLQTKKVRFES